MKKLLALLLILAMTLLAVSSCTIPGLGTEDTPDTGDNENNNGDGGNTDGGNTDGGNTDGGNTDGGNTDGGNTDGGNIDGDEGTAKLESSAGLKFSLNSSKENYTLVGIGTCTDKNIVVDTYEGLPVTTIGYHAFYESSAIESITLGDSVNRINQGAFEECTTLKSVKIGKNVQAISTDAFFGCSELTDVEIAGNALQTIDTRAVRRS